MNLLSLARKIPFIKREFNRVRSLSYSAGKRFVNETKKAEIKDLKKQLYKKSLKLRAVKKSLKCTAAEADRLSFKLKQMRTK